MDLLKVVNGDTGVNLCGVKGLMTKHLLQVPHRRAVPEHVRRARVPECVRAHLVPDPGSMGVMPDCLPYAPLAHPLALIIQDEVSGIGSIYK